MNYWAAAKAEQERAPADDLVRRHLGLALSMANRMKYADLDVEERLAVANLALCEAAKDWPKEKAKWRSTFVNYAATRIRNAIYRARGEAKNAGAATPKDARNMRRVRQEAETERKRLGRTPTAEEIANALGGRWNAGRVRAVQRLIRMSEYASLESSTTTLADGDEGRSLAETIADHSVDVESDVLERHQREADAEFLARAINDLPPTMRVAVSLRAGIRVPACERLVLDDVLRAGIRLVNNTTEGIKRLRKDETISALQRGTVVQNRRGDTSLFGKSPKPPTAKDRQHSAADFFNRLARDGQLAELDAAVGE